MNVTKEKPTIRLVNVLSKVLHTRAFGVSPKLYNLSQLVLLVIFINNNILNKLCFVT